MCDQGLMRCTAWSTCSLPANREKGIRVVSFEFSETLLKPQGLFVREGLPCRRSSRELAYGVGSGPGVVLSVVCSELSIERRAAGIN